MTLWEDKRECCGCAACADVCPVHCIVMKSDEEGFWYPETDEEACLKCGRCEKVCPGRHQPPMEEGGQWKTAFAAKAKDGDLRKRSSSGGVFGVLARSVIKKGGLVMGAAFDPDLQVRHQWADCEKELDRLYGSKYLQSNTEGCFHAVKTALAENREVLFCGTPCQIAALSLFLKGTAADQLLLVELICHGVPSPGIWNEYVCDRSERHKSKATHANFRDKECGWREFSLKMCFENGDTYRNTLDNDPYLKLFLKDMTLRPSCYACACKSMDSVGADLTIGDFWGIRRFDKKFDDDKGVSLVIVHGDKGRCAFEELKNQMDVLEVPVREAERTASALHESAGRPSRRGDYFAVRQSISPERAAELYAKESGFAQAKQYLSRAIRILQEKRESK